MHINTLHNRTFCRRTWHNFKTVLLIIFLGLATCLGSRADAGSGTIFTTDLSVPGWQIQEQPYRYVAQNLYEYINGAAEFFIAYGFVELKGANYAPVSGREDAVAVDVYDMGTRLNAFGVFQLKKDDQATVLKIGAASMASGDYVSFLKDKFYVEIQGYIINQQARSVLEQMAVAVADHLPGSSSLPPELSYFPEKGRIAGSERYIRGGILGHAFFDSGLVSDYQIRGEKVSAFIAMLPSSQKAAQAMEQHRAFLEESQKKCLPLDGFGSRGFISEEPYHKMLIETQSKTFVVGVYDLKSIQTGKALLADLLIHITSNQAAF